jgi:alcohol dehydrogenase
MLGNQASPPIPMAAVIAKELEIYGSHGMQAFEYGRLLSMIEVGTLQPDKLISDTVTLEKGAELLTRMNEFPNNGITVISFNG